jgi:hypothetical protein
VRGSVSTVRRARYSYLFAFHWEEEELGVRWWKVNLFLGPLLMLYNSGKHWELTAFA